MLLVTAETSPTMMQFNPIPARAAARVGSECANSGSLARVVDSGKQGPHSETSMGPLMSALDSATCGTCGRCRNAPFVKSEADSRVR